MLPHRSPVNSSSDPPAAAGAGPGAAEGDTAAPPSQLSTPLSRPVRRQAVTRSVTRKSYSWLVFGARQKARSQHQRSRSIRVPRGASHSLLGMLVSYWGLPVHDVSAMTLGNCLLFPRNVCCPGYDVWLRGSRIVILVPACVRSTTPKVISGSAVGLDEGTWR